MFFLVILNNFKIRVWKTKLCFWKILSFNCSSRSIRFCFSSRWAAQWLVSHVLHKVLPRYLEHPPGPTHSYYIVIDDKAPLSCVKSPPPPAPFKLRNCWEHCICISGSQRLSVRGSQNCALISNTESCSLVLLILTNQGTLLLGRKRMYKKKPRKRSKMKV